MKNYINSLREHNLKATPQRLAIVDALYINGHMNTETLYGLMIQKFSSISLATIYKNINIMIEKNFIQEVKLPHAKSVYELTKTSHSHLLCKKCGAIEDVEINLDVMIENISKTNQFQIDKTDFVLSGNCKNCQ
ncbi:MAG: Fur family transcriptional regulator [Campylobacterales bacterium]|nr:Fur family transcriptional regulator [Campylobacterales bacterium]